MEKTIDMTTSRGIGNAVLDVIGYWAGNYALNGVTSQFTRPKLHNYIIYGLVDIMSRNGYSSNKRMFNTRGMNKVVGKNVMVAIANAAVAIPYDYFMGYYKSLASAAGHNIARSLAALGANIVIDSSLSYSANSAKLI